MHMSAHYDSIILGAGPTGEVCAGALADAGQRVAIVERELVGGECSYWACIPSKTLLRPGEALAAAGTHRARGRPRRRDGRRRRSAGLARLHGLRPHRRGRAGWLEDKGIDLHRGSATFTGPGRIDVAGVG
jgi:dihydrolipoamide dehydrogenase